MCTALPVFRGEIQCRLLGMAVEAFTPKGTAASPDEAGELVCLKPFPCMPAGFWPLPGYGAPDAVAAAQKRYQDAYFSEFKDVWCECLGAVFERASSKLADAYLLASCIVSCMLLAYDVQSTATTS